MYKYVLFKFCELENVLSKTVNTLASCNLIRQGYNILFPKRNEYCDSLGALFTAYTLTAVEYVFEKGILVYIWQLTDH